MTLADALALGRVSNLPTVWTNLLAGAVLAGASPSHPALPALAAALALFYAGGMYLNDYFDAAIDAVERPERPIPAGRVRRATVGRLGFAMLGAALALTASVGVQAGSPWPPAAGAALAACIVLYDRHHKGNPLSPLLMGACRVLVYVLAGASVAAALAPELLAGAAVLLCYLIGLTYTAKQESLGRVRNLWPLAFLAAPAVYGAALAAQAPGAWPYLALHVAWVLVALRFVLRRGPGDIPRAVVSLIAGISLVDALLVAAAGAGAAALACVAGFALTLALQRYVAGT